VEKGEMLKNKIKEAGYSLRGFAEEIDMPYPTLYSILKNVNGAGIQNVNKICVKLGINLEEMATRKVIAQPLQEKYNITNNEYELIEKIRQLSAENKNTIISLINQLSK